MYAAGLLAWWLGKALGLRILGWVLMVMALVTPSTLPLVALLALALAPHPRAGRAGPRAKLTRLHELSGLPEHWQDTITRGV